MKRSWISILSLTLFFSCATTQKQQNKKVSSFEIISSEDEKDGADKVTAKQLNDEAKKSFAYSCKGCIMGSASETSIQNEDHNAFFLDNADHLGLKNRWFDIPVVYNDKVQKWITYFTTRGREYFKNYAKRSGKLAPLMSEILAHYGLPRDLIYLAMAESGFSTQAVSHASAVGPWQFIQSTGKNYGLKINYFVDERRDPLKATVAASKYLRDLYSYFGNWSLAKAGYNAGEGKIQRAVKRYSTKDFWEIAEGNYLKSETKDYVPKINALAIIGKNLKAFGFTDFDFYEPLDFEEIVLPQQSDLYKVADVLGVSFDSLRESNPELLRWHTPVSKSYILKVPVGTAKNWDYSQHSAQVKATDFQQYVVQKGGTLQQVARKFRVSSDALVALNNNHQDLGRGDVVKLPFRDDHSVNSALYKDNRSSAKRELAEARFSSQDKKRLAKLSKKDRRRALASSAKSKGKTVKKKSVYVVSRGDTLTDIARKTGIPLHQLIKKNQRLAKNGSIKPGDRVRIQ